MAINASFTMYLESVSQLVGRDAEVGKAKYVF